METNTKSSAYRINVGAVQNNVEEQFEFNAEDAIGKILCVNANAFIEQIEILEKEANYSGYVVFDVLYTSQNGDLLTLKQKSNFAGKLQNERLNVNMQPIYKTEIVDVSILSASSNNLAVQATVELNLDVLEIDNIEMFESDNSNIIVSHENVEVTTFVESGKQNFKVVEEFEQKQPIKKVLCYMVNAFVNDVTSGTGYFTVEGEVFVKTTLLFDTENLQTKTMFETIKFKEEIEVNNLTKNDLVKAKVYVNYDEVVVAPSEGDNTKLTVSVPLEVRYFVVNNTVLELPTDAYSLTHHINVVSESFQVQDKNLSVCSKEHIDGGIVLEDSQPRIGRLILTSGENVNVTNSYVVDNGVQIEGIASVNVVYETDDEEPYNNSVQVEIPFTFTVSTPVSDKDGLFIKVSVCDVQAKTKKGKEIEVDFDLLVCADLFNTKQELAIKEIELTEELMPNPYSLMLYLAPSGSTLWDIAKHLNVDEKIILEQNPDLVFPLEKSEKIVYFK